MKKQRKEGVIVVGDSFNNTLGLIRSLGRAGINPLLILVGDDRLFVSKSKYVRETIRVGTVNEAMGKLHELRTNHRGAWIICSNDKAAEILDQNEAEFSRYYRTPMQGQRIGRLFTKSAQCELAAQCGVTVPQSVIYNRGESIPQLTYPVLIKPNDSNRGEKADIHICSTRQELEKSLKKNSRCNQFIVQQFIDKDYEINLIGAVNEHGVAIPGGIRKLRHYPSPNGPCSFGVYEQIRSLPVDVEPLKRFVETTGYRGPFSIELLHADNTNYFMEMNFRHDGLAYAATAAGVNLLDFYINGKMEPEGNVKTTYLMDLSTDALHVREGRVSRWRWICNLLQTKCQLNFNISDPRPTVEYYRKKFLR
nr:hypothetical protein [Bacteroides sp.]